MKRPLLRLPATGLIVNAFTITTLAQTPPTLSLSLRLAEGEAVAERFGGSQVTLEIIRTGDPVPVVSTDLRLTPGGGPANSGVATPGLDFEAADQRVELSSGETSRASS